MATTVDCLPSELWLDVFRSLSQKDLLSLSRVSKQFRILAFDPTLWRTLELTLIEKVSEAQKILFGRCKLLSDLVVHCNSYTVHGCYKNESHIISDLVRLLVENCLSLNSLKLTNTPFLKPDLVEKLKNPTNCSITCLTTVIRNTEKGSVAADDDNVKLHQISTTDMYRKGNPYMIFRHAGSSILSFNILIAKQHISSVVLHINHCRTTADGIICMTVNGGPAEPTKDGRFGKKLIMAPRLNFGLENIAVNPELLREGLNKVTLCLDSSSPGVYWLSDLSVEVKYE